MSSSPHVVTQLLGELRAGRAEAFDQLIPLVYDELHELARVQRRRWEGDRTLTTTALVHEAYLKLSGERERDWENRSHFLAVASRAMRQILMDYAKRRNAKKRGGGWQRLDLDELKAAIAGPAVNLDTRANALLMLEACLERLEEVSPRQSRIAECRLFGGMTIKDTAEALAISPATVKRAWTMAQAWLYRELKATVAEV